MTTWQDHKKTIKGLDPETKVIIETLAELMTERMKSGISQRDFAERIGMSQPQLAKIERLDSIPTLKTLTRYAAGLDYNLSFQLTPKEKPHAV